MGTIVNGRYVLQAVLGVGGMGAVYLALDNHLNTPVALKEMSDSHLHDPAERQNAVTAFRNEATLLSTLCHPNLPRVTDFFAEGDNQFLVMDYVPGETLAQKLENRSQSFKESQVLAWAEQLCDVLNYLHTRQPPIIFRDLKPANVMVSPDGKTLKLIDFGIVRLFKVGASKDTMTIGTPGYAPPEQYGKAQTDARSDIYALGALLHHLLTLRDPATEMFKFPPARLMNSQVSAAVENAIQKAVRVKADDRWDSVAEFKTALLDGQGALPPPAVPISSPASPPKPHPAAPLFPPIAPPGVAPSFINPAAVPSMLDTAGLGPRIGAYLLDNFLLGLVMGVVAIFIFGANSNADEAMPVYLAIAAGSMLGYFSLFHSTSGQTPGKKNSSIKVVRMDGSRLGFVRALWRTLMMIAPASLITLAFGGLPIGALIWLIPLFNSERRAFHDYLSDTRVVKS
jgi:serine/threonine protein kinase